MRLLIARERIDQHLTALFGLHKVVLAAAPETAGASAKALGAVMEGIDALPSLRHGAEALFSVAGLLGPAATPLFGAGWKGSLNSTTCASGSSCGARWRSR